MGRRRTHPSEAGLQRSTAACDGWASTDSGSRQFAASNVNRHRFVVSREGTDPDGQPVAVNWQRVDVSLHPINVNWQQIDVSLQPSDVDAQEGTAR
jgi:hypothetical protein